MNRKSLIAIVLCGIIVATIIFGAYQFGRKSVNTEQSYAQGYALGFSQGLNATNAQNSLSTNMSYGFGYKAGFQAGLNASKGTG